jgi:predicted CXXCH cytochrome family protein
MIFMGDRFQHARHVLRVGAVLGVGLVAFLVARWALIPSDFGVLGYYRAGALTDARARPIAYAGRAACMECHNGAYDPPEPEAGAPARKTALTTPLDPVRDNKHFKLNCEACHGPLQKHVADEDKALPVPKVGSDALCLGCHRRLDGRPKTQPQVLPATHKKSGDEKKDACVACHKPHWPKIEDK